MPDPRPPLFLYGPLITKTPPPATDDRIREQKPASIVGAQLYDHHGRAVAMLSNRPELNVVAGDLVWSRRTRTTTCSTRWTCTIAGHAGEVEPVVVWVDYPTSATCAACRRGRGW